MCVQSWHGQNNNNTKNTCFRQKLKILENAGKLYIMPLQINHKMHIINCAIARNDLMQRDYTRVCVHVCLISGFATHEVIKSQAMKLC